jgi:hypothetical protein
VRRKSGPLSPPTQIGIGFCTGFAVKSTSSNLTYFPENLGKSAVQSSLHTSIHSSVTCLRSSNGAAPVASNSSRHQPTPIASVRRPLDRKRSWTGVWRLGPPAGAARRLPTERVAPILGGYLLAIGVAPTRIFLVDCFFALIAAASTVLLVFRGGRGDS